MMELESWLASHVMKMVISEENIQAPILYMNNLGIMSSVVRNFELDTNSNNKSTMGNEVQMAEHADIVPNETVEKKIASVETDNHNFLEKIHRSLSVHELW